MLSWKRPMSTLTIPPADLLTWLHIGDLHIDGEEPGELDALRTIAEQIGSEFANRLDFVYLPGDIADHGTAYQYRLVRQVLDGVRPAVRAIPGDHDFEPGSLDAFHHVLGAGPLPAAETISGCRCLFLDIVSAGRGGPDFRLGKSQLSWLDAKLGRCAASGLPVALFMHSCPADLGPDAARLQALLDRHPVAIIDMGHTHYNELGNDGCTIYAATRSTAQVEEGPVGFSVSAIDGGSVSWRFKPLDSPWPFVLITAPADRRLATSLSGPAHGATTVRALAWDRADIARVTCSVDDGAPVAMRAHGQVWSCPWTAQGEGEHRVVVRAETASGAIGEDCIVVVAGDFGGGPARRPAGSDANAVGAWEDRHILGTQLGPNRNGRKW